MYLAKYCILFSKKSMDGARSFMDFLNRIDFYNKCLSLGVAPVNRYCDCSKTISVSIPFISEDRIGFHSSPCKCGKKDIVSISVDDSGNIKESIQSIEIIKKESIFCIKS